MLEEIGLLIEFYRKEARSNGIRKYSRNQFILDCNGNQICNLRTYYRIASGNTTKKIDSYKKLSINLNRDFCLFRDIDDAEFFPTLISNICKILEIRKLCDIYKHLDYIKSILKDRPYIWYEELYQSILFIESIIYGKPIDKSIDIDKIAALAYITSNQNFKHILLYFLNYYYFVYEQEKIKRLKILDELISESAVFEKSNSYYKYIYIIKITDKREDYPISIAKRWYENESSVYGKYLSIKAYEYIIHGESNQAIELIEEAQKLIKDNPSYFTNLERATMYHQKGSHFYMIGSPERGFYELHQSILFKNIISRLSTLLLFFIFTDSNSDDYQKFQYIFKNLHFNKTSGVRLLIRCFDYIYIQENYKKAQNLLLDNIFDWFIIDSSNKYASKLFMELLNKCVQQTKDYHLLTEYTAKENKVFNKELNNQ